MPWQIMSLRLFSALLARGQDREAAGDCGVPEEPCDDLMEMEEVW